MEIKNKEGKVIFTVEGNSLVNADLRDADLQNADLRGADLRNADLWYADLWYANLRGADLQNANLRGANLRGANLRDAELQNAELQNANLRDANLQNADLDFSCFPLWCGSLNMKVDKRIAIQLAYHFCRLVCNDEETKEMQSKLKDYANKFHRVDECGKIE